ncbi:MAG: nucleoside hydrolase [Chitinophagaceae bacterium]|nr:MAG: nucleoside hydrolase [Chitinophagaceae bacterium]
MIVDLDIDSDVDDVSALAMLHTMHNKGQIDLLGVIITSDDSSAAFCADVINTYYGNPKMPIGILKNQAGVRNHSKYTSKVASEFPRRHKHLKRMQEARSLYRRLLANSPDGSVVIVTIGHLTNLQGLLQSPGDRYSRLGGLALVNKKVSKWICMGGQFPEGKEANFYRPDPASTVYCIDTWTLPVVFAGWEVGEKIITGGDYLKGIIESSSPVYRAYELYNNFKGRASWDQVAVLLLTKEADEYFDYIADGTCVVAGDGSNKWVKGSSSNHSYIRLKPETNVNVIARFIDDMVVK